MIFRARKILDVLNTFLTCGHARFADPNTPRPPLFRANEILLKYRLVLWASQDDKYIYTSGTRGVLPEEPAALGTCGPETRQRRARRADAG